MAQFKSFYCVRQQLCIKGKMVWFLYVAMLYGPYVLVCGMVLMYLHKVCFYVLECGMVPMYWYVVWFLCVGMWYGSYVLVCGMVPMC